MINSNIIDGIIIDRTIIDEIIIKDIPEKKIERFLKYKIIKADEKTKSRINTLKEKLMSLCKPLYTYNKYPIKKDEQGVKITGTDVVLKGGSINKFLKDNDEIFLTAVTLGFESERFITYTQKVSLSEGLLADIIASAYIDEACDVLESSLSQNYKIKGRFSCGFGDFSIDVQPEILRVLNTQKEIGLYCNENNIMLPRKSLTAVIGIEK